MFYCDELNRGKDPVQGRIQELLTDRYDPKTGEKFLQYYNADLQKRWMIPIENKEGRAVFRFLTTMNMGDRGVVPMSDALRRRFNLFVEMDYLPKDQEVEILFNEGKKRVPKEIIEGIVDVANDVRMSFRRCEPSTPHTADTGTLIDMVKLLSRRSNPRSLRVIKDVAMITLIKKISVYESSGYAAEESVKANLDLIEGKILVNKFLHLSKKDFTLGLRFYTRPTTPR